jgi:hypothetical protein
LASGGSQAPHSDAGAQLAKVTTSTAGIKQAGSR